MRYLICTFCIVLLLWGCDNTAAVPAKPKVVRKKIVAPEDNTAQVRRNTTVRAAKAKPAATPQTQTVVAKVDKPLSEAKEQPAVKPDNGSRQLIAQNAKPGTAPNDQPAPVIQKKPAISPKSEITEIEQAVKEQTRPGGNQQPASGEKLKDTQPTTASNTVPGGLPAMYNPAGKIDPFEPLFREKPLITKKKKEIKRIPRTPLERIDLSQLKLVGIILASSGNRALVEESSGKGYVVKPGTYIGTNGGKIVQIEKEIVTVEEKFEDVFGKIQTRKKELKLPKPPGEF
jgi:type IV pilus assembly protein PilP